MASQLTNEEMREFLSSGVVGAEWPKGKTIIWTIVDGCSQKHVYTREEGGPHAEIQFITDLTRIRKYRRDGKRRRVDTVRNIEMFCNYSPCDECAAELQQLVFDHPGPSITIKCAKLYRVDEGDDRSEKNRRALKNLKSKNGIQVESFDFNDWSRLLHEASNLQGYDYLQPLEALEFPGREAGTISTGRQDADDNVREMLKKLYPQTWLYK